MSAQAGPVLKTGRVLTTVLVFSFVSLPLGEEPGHCH